MSQLKEIFKDIREQEAHQILLEKNKWYNKFKNIFFFGSFILMIINLILLIYLNFIK
jgi:hypothetical protein